MAPARVTRAFTFTLTLGLAALAAAYYATRAPDWDATQRVIVAFGFITFGAVLWYADHLARRAPRR